MIARSTGAAPRQRGSSDGWTLSQSRSVEQRRRDQQPVGADDDRVARRARAPPSAAPAAAPGSRAARRRSFAGGAASLRPRPRGRSGRVSSAATSCRAASRSSTSAPNGAVAATAILRQVAYSSTSDEPRPQRARAPSLRRLARRAVEDQHAVEVVELVLDDAGREPLELELQRRSPSTSSPSIVTSSAALDRHEHRPAARGSPRRRSRSRCDALDDPGLTTVGRVLVVAAGTRTGAGARRPASRRARRRARRASGALIRSASRASSSSNSSTSCARMPQRPGPGTGGPARARAGDARGLRVELPLVVLVCRPRVLRCTSSQTSRASLVESDLRVDVDDRGERRRGASPARRAASSAAGAPRRARAARPSSRRAARGGGRAAAAAAPGPSRSAPVEPGRQLAQQRARGASASGRRRRCATRCRNGG